MVVSPALRINNGILRIISHDRRFHDVLTVLMVRVDVGYVGIQEFAKPLHIFEDGIAAGVPIVVDTIINRWNGMPGPSNLSFAWCDAVFRDC